MAVKFTWKLANLERPAKQATGKSLVQKRRMKFTDAIAEQQAILAADLAGKSYAAPLTKKGKTKRILRWWWEANGGVNSEIKYGTKPVSLRKGQQKFTTIMVDSLTELNEALNAVKQMTNDGELDEELEMVSARGPVTRKKK